MTQKIAFIFPGQGSQAIGMGKAFYESTEIGKKRFEEASEVLGFDLMTPCFQGPEEALKKTAVTQPALYVVGSIAAEILREKGIEPTHTAGHSLGEYTSLGAAGVYDFATGLRLVKARGEAMNAAAEATKGAMAAIIGLDIAAIEEICKEAQTHGIVNIANINDPSQTVISGEPDAVSAVVDAAKAKGAKRALPLPVHGAFHSPLMASAQKPMGRALGDADLSAPKTKFVANTTASFLTSPEEIEKQLVAQITGCVRWVECIRTLIDDGVDTFIELGSGKVLSGLMRRIERSATCLSAGDPEAVDKVIDTLSVKS